jgi:predicted DNA-binding transcriptional regulator YafY
MPNNKNAFERFIIIDKLLHNIGNGYYTQTELYNKLNNELEDRGLQHISLRTFQNDINEMIFGELKAPIILNWDNRERIYMYSDKHFTIDNNKSLNEQEKNILKDVLISLSSFQGRTNFEWLEQIKSLLNTDTNEDKIRDKVISYEENIDLHNRELITDLYNYITSKIVINIKYKKFNAKSIIYTISPYYLKQYNCRWFLIGKNKDYPNIQTYALDRIEKIQINYHLKYETNYIDFDDYFYDIIGVTRYKNNPIVDIVLWVDNDFYPYICTKPIHPTQKYIKSKDAELLLKNYPNLINGKFIKITISINSELISLLLSMGNHIIVLSPRDLQNDILDKIKKSYKNYLTCVNRFHN